MVNCCVAGSILSFACCRMFLVVPIFTLFFVAFWRVVLFVFPSIPSTAIHFVSLVSWPSLIKFCFFCCRLCIARIMLEGIMA